MSRQLLCFQQPAYDRLTLNKHVIELQNKGIETRLFPGLNSISDFKLNQDEYNNELRVNEVISQIMIRSKDRKLSPQVWFDNDIGRVICSPHPEDWVFFCVIKKDGIERFKDCLLVNILDDNLEAHPEFVCTAKGFSNRLYILIPRSLALNISMFGLDRGRIIFHRFTPSPAIISSGTTEQGRMEG